MAFETMQSDPIRVNSAANTNPSLQKAGKCVLASLVCSNIGGAAAYVKVYDKAAAPTVGTDTPILVVPVPAGGLASVPAGHLGINLQLGLALAITNLGADSDTTAVAAGQIKVLGSVAG